MGQAGELERALARAKREIGETAQLERRRTAAAGQALLTSLRSLEWALTNAAADLDRISRSIASSNGAQRDRRVPEASGPTPAAGPTDAVPVGALAVASRLAREGHSREDIHGFLEESFSDIDASAVIEQIFRLPTIDA